MRAFLRHEKHLEKIPKCIWRVHEYPSYKREGIVRGGIDLYTYKIPFHYS
jgi:hypothetical protein